MKLDTARHLRDCSQDILNNHKTQKTALKGGFLLQKLCAYVIIRERGGK